MEFQEYRDKMSRYGGQDLYESNLIRPLVLLVIPHARLVTSIHLAIIATTHDLPCSAESLWYQIAHRQGISSFSPIFINAMQVLLGYSKALIAMDLS